jgi:hypothetical protein
MRAIVFILSTLIILAAITAVIKHKGGKLLGLELSKKWLFGIIIAELLLLILAMVDYNMSSDSSIANDLLWHNMVSYYRGVLPIAGLAGIFDFKMNNVVSNGLLMFLGALFSDYIILRVASLIKKLIKK